MSNFDEEPIKNPYFRTDPERAVIFEQGYVSAIHNLGHTAVLRGYINDELKQIALDHAEDAIDSAHKSDKPLGVEANTVFELAVDMPNKPGEDRTEHEEYLRSELAALNSQSDIVVAAEKTE